MNGEGPYLNDAAYLGDQLAWLDLVLRRGVERARSGRDGWGGLCITDEGVDWLLRPAVDEQQLLLHAQFAQSVLAAMTVG